MEILKNALVMPHIGNMDKFTEGIYRENGEFIDDSLVRRGTRPQICAAEQFIDDTCIYGGCLYGHFGHFIWESLSRLAVIRKCNDLPIVFVSPNLEIHKSQKIFLRKIGIKNCLYLIKRPTRINKLVYSSPESAVDPVYMNPVQMNSLACFEFNRKTAKKVWLSRNKLKCGKILNEIQLENILKIIGFEIFYPENMSLYEQVKLVGTSKVVAGFDGSQFFSVLFSKNVFGKFFIFNRREGKVDTIPYVMDRKEIDYNYYNYNVKLIDGTPGNAGSNYLSLDIDRIVAELNN